MTLAYILVVLDNGPVILTRILHCTAAVCPAVIAVPATAVATPRTTLRVGYAVLYLFKRPELCNKNIYTES